MHIKIAGRQVDIRIVVGTGAALVVGVVLVMALSRRPADNKRDGPAQSIGNLYDWVTVDMLHIPNELAIGTTPRWVPYRDRRERWSVENVEEYWLDPQEIGIDILEETVHDEIYQLLEAFP